ncbi:OLC1v1001000C1 [Oldenlandia corymbosa var. corymbosa]|uniref:OLC1v1001000C1 n=1 Tax=Oldenlandia corymbosa var. corymbosa TaxID=529605 RepID=A0AAV1D555_OLDCO|nr:OLC1v1001000C1 [Oldenlandia corymbosa var. corymbosa]
MVLSRKRPAQSLNTKPNNSFIPPFAPNPAKVPKPSTSSNQHPGRPKNDSILSPPSAVDSFVAVLADAGCTLINPAGPTCLPSDLHKFRHRLHRRFSDEAALRSDFLHGLSGYINTSSDNLRRVLLPSHCENTGSVRNESLIRVLLLVESIQLDVQILLLEKLPEYFEINNGNDILGPSSVSLDEDIARLILNQFRWLDFLVDSQLFTEKLFQILSICPLRLKKEIIGSLPEVLGDENNKVVVDSLQQMLHEDSSIIVPVLDTFSNLILDDLLRDEVNTVALSCIRTVEVENMPYLLRFLLLSATPQNARHIIAKVREQVKFLGTSNISRNPYNKHKGKLVADDVEASILDALKSSLRFKSTLCQEILKELKSVERVQDHKVIDVWLLILVYMNSESMQKIVQNLLKKKIVEGGLEERLFDQCIQGNKELAQDYLPIFLSISEYLLACKEKRAREFGNHLYKCLFEEFHNTYLRQEVLGALVTHVGSGIGYEANAALEVMVLLASNYPQELIKLSSHLIGILDYLESFNIEGLHKVYEIFSILALFTKSSTDQCGSSIKNELLMIIRKQVNNPDLAYKRMGLIGTLKIVFHLGDVKNNSSPSPSLKSNYEEALELLETSFESCKHLPLPLILFYEELADTVQTKMLHPAIAEWIGKHVGEFESKYLLDLSGGALLSKDSYCGLEGELWMNLDGDISPVCLNILPLVSSSLLSPSPLEVLPAYFVLLSAIERLANQGSLGGIDALLGCPLHLPSSKYFSYSIWRSLSGKQKQILVLSLYYAVNWIRELLNAFCLQIAEDFDSISQATKGEITHKLLRRLRNLVFLESLLNESLKRCPQSLPELYPCIHPETSNRFHSVEDLGKKSELSQEKRNASQNCKRNSKKTTKASDNSAMDGKFRQPRITEMLKKVGPVTSQVSLNEESTSVAASTCEDAEQDATESDAAPNVEISGDMKMVEAQKRKFRPLQDCCFTILSFEKNPDPCCSDPAAELPLHLYLLQDLNQKLDYFVSSSKGMSLQCMSTQLDSTEMKEAKFLNNIRPLFPSLRGCLDCAFNGLKEGAEICQDHWNHQSVLSGNPNIANMTVTKSAVYCSVFVEILSCFGKMLNCWDILKDHSALSFLLEALQPVNIPDSFLECLESLPATGSIDYFFCGAYCFLEGVFDTARTLSFKLASEGLLVLNSVVLSIQKFVDISTKGIKGNDTGYTRKLLHFLSNRLGASSHNLLFQKCDDVIDKNSKAKGHILQKILHIYLAYSKSTSDSLNELACSILPQVNSRRTVEEDDICTLPTFCPATFAAWYRVMHAENVAVLNNLMKEIARLEKPQAVASKENVDELLNKLEQSVNVVVSLVNSCRTHEKVAVHGMAVKYGGKFIDTFLKVFGFLQNHFQTHNKQIIHVVKELQKATRTMQSLCSEAKASKQTVITSKIPATKRSMERFLFHVKALLHSTGECTFWMGNLKHKDLTGHVVSSQAYMDDQNENIDEDATVSDDQNENPNGEAGKTSSDNEQMDLSH